MEISSGLNDVLTLGMNMAIACWPVLSIVCTFGLVFLLAGHRFSVPGAMLINKVTLCIMAAILILSGAFLGLTVYAWSLEHDYLYGALIFTGTMLIPIALSIIGLLLARFSRFPIRRDQRTPR